MWSKDDRDSYLNPRMHVLRNRLDVDDPFCLEAMLDLGSQKKSRVYTWKFEHALFIPSLIFCNILALLSARKNRPKQDWTVSWSACLCNSFSSLQKHLPLVLASYSQESLTNIIRCSTLDLSTGESLNSASRFSRSSKLEFLTAFLASSEAVFIRSDSDHLSLLILDDIQS